ncbi:hypothetical protein CMO89_03935 [Candidatus Woesearchaeota archaeon]|nr:hypothetical protein [Candidatus Woesearchaeota archaeon]|tara:strand:- start:13429 stop:14019 length:591 start_codon:yes stop_codon:yes gene_type:complete
MILSEEQYKKIEEFALDKVSKLDYNHDHTHVIRTIKFVEILAKKENADVEVCRVAALLHDIGQSVERENHEERSTKMTREFLSSMNLPNDFVENVCHAIRCHQTSYVKNAKTIEAKVVYDADKLQVVGVFGFCRVFTHFAVFQNFNLKDAVEKVKSTQGKKILSLQTKSAKEMVSEPHKLMKEFYELYDKWDEVDF